MFVVQPFHKDSDIRSALGFMSIASRWGDYLFPGITVLTRDLYAVQAMHQVAVQQRAWDAERRHVFRGRSTDAKIARQLSRNLARDGVHRPPDKLLQVMTYWQRYGSLFVHFNLLENRRNRSVDWYRDLIFAPSKNDVGQDVTALRRRRLTHFRWYRANRRYLSEVNGPTLGSLFTGEYGRWRRWWLTGWDVPEHVPHAIHLVRQLEFFFIVWQTLFEAAVRAVSFEGRLSLRPFRTGDLVKRLLRLVLENKHAHQETTNRDLVRVCLGLHDKLVGPHAGRWQASVSKLLGAHADRFVRLHNDETIAEFSRRQGPQLMDGLAELHNEYCEIQGKPYAASVQRFRPTPAVIKGADISLDLSPRRWGLFGYRFEAAVGLFQSEAI